jgi:hypothetical protein
MPADTHERIYGITQIRAVTPSDTTDLALGGVYPRAIYVGGAGNLAVVGVDDTSAVTMTGIATGVWHPICVKRVMSTNTTATLILAGY